MNKEKWRVLQSINKAYLQSLDPVIRQYGMTRAEIDVLLFLANNPGADRAADIVEMRGLTKSHVSIAVKALCEKGYLETELDECDRRVTHLKLTQQAGELSIAARKAQKQFFENLFADFTQEDMAWWQKLQAKLAGNTRAMLE